MSGLGRHYLVEYTTAADGRSVLAAPRDPASQVTTAPDGQRVNYLAAGTTDFSVTKYDSGRVSAVGASSTGTRIVSLPATQAGLKYTFISSAYSSAYALQISPTSTDKIMGNGFTAADNKDAINTIATAKVGDAVTLIGDGVDGWYLIDVIGTWAREG